MSQSNQKAVHSNVNNNTHSTVNALITDNIDLWTSAIKKRNATGRGSNKKIELSGIKKLRELILELAVRGKLVPQDASDEPASVLLERIAKEKVQLVADKKIKKSKVLPEISDEEKPFELPNGWEWVRLQTIFKISSGNGLTSKQMNKKGKVPVYGGNGVTGYHDTENVNKPTLVIGRVGFYCGSVHITPETAWVTDNAFITTFSEQNIDIDYLSWLLKATDLNENDSATAQPVISGRKLYPIVVCLPPLPEQHRIVAKVDELMILCDQLEQQTEQSLSAHQTLVEVLLAALTKSDSAVPVKESFQTNWQRLAEHFDVLFTTEASIEQLKQTILQLAVMGKLVPQNPDDEPASVLLEKIAKEKARLIADKKIKKQKLLPEITDEEKPFELPSGWEYLRFGYYSNEIATGPFGSMIHKRDYIENGTPLINPSHMINSTIKEDMSITVSKQKTEDLASYTLFEHDI
ncbi:MAG: restriction endonuclease subunit S, partial [Colwellia sp.]|nr:restriction endonuclease subunit S [Colwellia sp.]